MSLSKTLRRYVQLATKALGPAVCSQVALSSLPTIPRPGTFTATSTGVQAESHQTIVAGLAARASDQYRVPLPPLQVIVADLDDAAAKIRIGTVYTQLIVAQRYSYDAAQLISIVAHEIAHYVLERAGISLECTVENERLTDSVAVFAGFGPVMLKGYLKSTSNTVGLTTYTRTETLGYLSIPEIRSLHTHREQLVRGTTKHRRAAVITPDRITSCWFCYNRIRLPQITATVRLRCRACGAYQVARYTGASDDVLHRRIIRVFQYVRDRLYGLPD